MIKMPGLNNFVHTAKVIWAGIRLSYYENLAFGFSSSLVVISNILYIGLFMMFWQSLLQKVGTIPGWSLGEMAVYLAYVEFFHAVVNGLGGLAINSYLYILTGRLDTLLIRPVDPRIMLLVFGIRIEEWVRSIPSVVILFCVAAVLGTKLSASGLVMGFAAAVLSAIAMVLLRLTGSSLSFWLGSVKGVQEFIQSLDVLTNYPLTILGTGVRAAFTILLPIGYAATEPALAGLARINPWWMLAGVLALLAIWLAINEIVWRFGREVYESYGG